MGCKLAKTIFAESICGSRFAERNEHTQNKRTRIKLENELVKESELILVWMIWSIKTFRGEPHNGDAVFRTYNLRTILLFIPLLYLLLARMHTHTHTHSRAGIFPYSRYARGAATKSGWVLNA